MSIIHVISSLGQGLLRAEHDDGERGSAPPAPPKAARPNVPSLDALDALFEKAKRDAIVVPNENLAPIRKLGNDYQRVYPEWTRDAILIEAEKYGGDGVYAMTKEVADAFVRRRRGRMVFGALLFLACDGESNIFMTYTKVNASRAASTCFKAIKAAMREWTWVTWVGGRDGYYDFDHPPAEKPKAPPNWPDDKTPDEICDAVFAGDRFITSVDHWLVSRILNGG